MWLHQGRTPGSLHLVSFTHVTFPFADYAVHPLAIKYLSNTIHWILSPPSKSSNLGMVLGTPKQMCKSSSRIGINGSGTLKLESLGNGICTSLLPSVSLLFSVVLQTDTFPSSRVWDFFSPYPHQHLVISDFVHHCQSDVCEMLPHFFPRKYFITHFLVECNWFDNKA